MFYVFHENTKGELAGKYAKLIREVLRYCYYVLGTVYETSFICRAVHLNFRLFLRYGSNNDLDLEIN